VSINKKVKKYGCVKCGTPFKIHPPDDLHTTASRDEKACEIRGAIKMGYVCANCGATTLFTGVVDRIMQISTMLRLICNLFSSL